MRDFSLARQASCLFLKNSLVRSLLWDNDILFCLVYFLFFQLKVGRVLDVPSSSHRRCSRNCFERFCCARNLNDFFYRKTAYAELFLPVFNVLVRLVEQQHRQRQRWRFVLVFSSGYSCCLGFLKCCWPQLAAEAKQNRNRKKNIR